MSDSLNSFSEWLNSNGHRSFPLADDFAGKSWNKPEWSVPDWLIRDARFVVVTDRRSAVSPLCSRLVGFWFRPSVDHVSVEARVSVYHGEGDPRYTGQARDGQKHFVFRADVPFGDVRAVRMFQSGGGGSVSALVVLGSPSSRSDARPYPSGLVQFNDDVGGIPFVPSRTVVVPGGLGVSSIRVGGVDASGTVHVANGVNTEATISGGRIRVVAAPGVGVHPDCWEYDPDYVCEYIHFINGQHADTDGSFQIVGGEGVTVVNNLRSNGVPAIAVVADFEASRNSRYVHSGVPGQ